MRHDGGTKVHIIRKLVKLMEQKKFYRKYNQSNNMVAL